MKTTTPEFSAVVLGYKEGDRLRGIIPEMAAEIQKHTDNWEIILVANFNRGDTADETPRVAAELAKAEPRIRVLALEKQGMMGWDARHGLDMATGDYVALIDGDGQNPPQDLGRTYEIIRAEKLDMVMVYRQTREDGPFRILISGVFNRLFRLLFPGLPVRDINAKPKVFSRDFFKQLKLVSDDWFLDAEIMIQTRRLNGRVKTIASVFHPARARASFVKPRHILEFLWNLAKARLRG